jgi:hypothetical protein
MRPLPTVTRFAEGENLEPLKSELPKMPVTIRTAPTKQQACVTAQAMAIYAVRPIGSKARQNIEASSPSEAAYLFEGTGAPMELLPQLFPGSWRFRRFDERPHNGFTVVVINEQLT